MSTLPHANATHRNRQPILDQLQGLLPKKGIVLEIGSGTGQHAVFFTRHLTGLVWQPTDRQENLPGLVARFAAEGNERILSPLQLDVLGDRWPRHSFAAAFSANTAHIMSWEAVQAMFAGVAAQLADGARFCLYGPFNIDGDFTSPSNAQFDAHLRRQDLQMGIRDMAEVEILANHHGMPMERKMAMPANNFILVFKKR